MASNVVLNISFLSSTLTQQISLFTMKITNENNYFLGWLCRYYPSRVRRKAMAALDAAFPVGSRSRMLVSCIFRLMHPSDLPMLMWYWLGSIAHKVFVVYSLGSLRCATRAVFALLSLVLASLAGLWRARAQTWWWRTGVGFEPSGSAAPTCICESWFRA